MNKSLLLSFILCLGLVSTTPYTEFFDGLVSNLTQGLKLDARTLDNCLVNQTYPERENLLEGGKLLKSPRPRDVIKGLNMVGVSSEKILEMATNCTQGYARENLYQIKKFNYQLIDALYLTVNEFNETLINQVNATDFAIQAREAALNNSINGVGQAIGNLITQFKKEEQKAMEVYNLLRLPGLLVGFVHGFGHESGYNSSITEECFSDIDETHTNYEQGFLKIFHGNYTEGLIDLLVGFSSLTQGIPACRAEFIFSEIQTQQFKNITKANILANKRQVHKELVVASLDFQEKKYYQAGFTVGEVTYQVVFGTHEKPQDIVEHKKEKREDEKDQQGSDKKDGRQEKKEEQKEEKKEERERKDHI